MSAPSVMRFDGRVVVVTGAGGGLGRVYALEFAKRGASVVVNDLGGSRTGEGASSMAADKVVEEIRSAGGKAVANYNSVEDGDKIIETALNAFGRVDIVINNAGILRDKSVARMTDDDWDLIMKVHLKGSYKVTKAAWDIMLKQGYGRIINTASAAGIYGNFGQANYSAAKLALHGLTMSLAREGGKKNVLVNTIAPLAASRLTETVMPPEVLAALKPEFIAPLVMSLCHENCQENGSLFEVGAGFHSKLRRQRARGVVFKADPTFNAGAVQAKWDEICSFGQSEYPNSIMDTDWMAFLERAKQLPQNPTGKALRYDGRVVLVTGAGGGLGRAYALEFAKMGASVVVNDLGGSTTGSGASSMAADKVVDEIRAMGGKAVANYDSVEDGDKLVDTAIQAFGRIDVIVNNAGILRDKSFTKMTDQDWDLVMKVHLRGTFKVTKAAWPHFLKQQYGRIINTCSAVGLYGNFGQTNYSAAKAGILAFSNTCALEGKKSNIMVNTIAPNAGTRMTATIMPPEMVEALKPDYVAPLVTFLGHEENQTTGGCYECGSGWISKVRWQRTGGVGFPVDAPLTPEMVVSKWREITNFDDGSATFPTTTQESFQQVHANFENKARTPAAGAVASQSSGGVSVSKAKDMTISPLTFNYTEKDVILYALGVGAKRTELPLVYENDSKFGPLPTFGVVPGLSAVNNVPMTDILPSFNPMMLLHGEQYLELVRPIPSSGKLVSKPRVVDILDKGKAASLVVGVDTFDGQGNKILYNESTLFIRGIGGFGQGVPPAERVPAAVATNNPPNRAPDAVVREKTHEDQAALYRLSGDYNPLHIDPEMSKMGGFDVPILHGLCTFGIAGKHIFQKFCDGDMTKFKSIKARFAKHVFPGETLETSMWKESNKIIFTVKVVERDAIAISNAAVELATSSSASAKEDQTGKSGMQPVPGFASSKIFEDAFAALSAKSETDRKSEVSKVKAVFQFDVAGSSGKKQSWFIDLKNGIGAVGLGAVSGKPDLVIAVNDADLVDLATGKINGQKAYMQGKIKTKGNLMLATKLDTVLKNLRNGSKL